MFQLNAEKYRVGTFTVLLCGLQAIALPSVVRFRRRRSKGTRRLLSGFVVPSFREEPFHSFIGVLFETLDALILFDLFERLREFVGFG